MADEAAGERDLGKTAEIQVNNYPTKLELHFYVDRRRSKRDLHLNLSVPYCREVREVPGETLIGAP